MSVPRTKELIKKLAAWKTDPCLFVIEAIGAKPSEQQTEALALIPKEKRITIRSGHGTGKDALAAWVILWFLTTRPYAKVVCTAPTARQLSDILWSEVSKWLRKSILSEEFVIQQDKIFHKDAPKEHWVRAVSPSVKASPEEQGETLAGFHGEHLLIIVDEASGVADPVYVPLEGAMTQEDNRCLLIGNMTKNTGYFYDTHFHNLIKGAWTRLHWDSRNSSNVAASMVDYFRNKYGEDSNVFRIRVAGDPPLADEESFIQLHWAQQCVGRDIVPDPLSPFYLGVDVARFGNDSSVILPRQGDFIHPWETFQKMDTVDLAGHIIITFNELAAAGIAIDEIGLGAGVVDILGKHQGFSKISRTVFGINVSRASSNHTRWHRLRDELWWKVREKCLQGAYSFPVGSAGDELVNELSMPRYKFDNNSAYVVESKKDLKARGRWSPNIADALCLSEYFHSTAHRLFAQQEKKAKPYSHLPWALQQALAKSRHPRSRSGWMTV